MHTRETVPCSLVDVSHGCSNQASFYVAASKAPLLALEDCSRLVPAQPQGVEGRRVCFLCLPTAPLAPSPSRSLPHLQHCPLVSAPSLPSPRGRWLMWLCLFCRRTLQPRGGQVPAAVLPVAVQALPQLPAAVLPPAAEADPGLTQRKCPPSWEPRGHAPGDPKWRGGAARKDHEEGSCLSTPNTAKCTLPSSAAFSDVS